jgi:hypothetical protein
MATQSTPTLPPARTMQGIAVPANSVNPVEFFRRTRRHTNTEKVFNYIGQLQETVELLKSDILAGVVIKFTGQVVITPGTGSVDTTSRWPFDFINNAAFTANGASNLISCSGLKLKIREVMKKTDLDDRGVTQTFAGVARSQGTLTRASEAWGVGSATTAIAGGTYPIELEWVVPVAEDEFDLAGAIFLATATSDLTVNISLAQIGDLFKLTGNGTAALTGSFQVSTRKFSVPIGADGEIVVPDLSLFHSMIQSRSTAVQNGQNETRIIGQGAGKSLLRMFYQVYNGLGQAAVPLSMNRTNFGRQSWAYGTNEVPDAYNDGQHMRGDEESRYNTDVGAVWGVGCFDFVHENAFRDVVDLGTTSDLRIQCTIQTGVVLASPAIEYVTETVYNAGGN